MVFTFASFVSLVAEHDVPDPTYNNAVRESHPESKPDEVFPHPPWGFLLFGAAHVTQSTNRSAENDRQNEKTQSVFFIEFTFFEA